MNQEDLQGWSLTQLFNLIQLAACPAEALHNDITAEHEEKQQ